MATITKDMTIAQAIAMDQNIIVWDALLHRLRPWKRLLWYMG